MEGTKPIIIYMEGTRPLRGASPTQPYKCGQCVKVKINIVTQPVPRPRRGERPRSPVIFDDTKHRPASPTSRATEDGRPYIPDTIPTNAVFDFDFNILTAFIRLGRAGPAGAGCPP